MRTLLLTGFGIGLAVYLVDLAFAFRAALSGRSFVADFFVGIGTVALFLAVVCLGASRAWA